MRAIARQNGGWRRASAERRLGHDARRRRDRRPARSAVAPRWPDTRDRSVHRLVGREDRAAEHVAPPGDAALGREQVALDGVGDVGDADARVDEHRQAAVEQREQDAPGPARAPRSLHGRRVHEHDVEPGPRRLLHHRLLALGLRALVVGEERAAVRRVLAADRPLGLAERRRRRGVDEPPHPGRGRGAHDRPRAVAVDAVQRRRVGRAQRVDARDVVGDRAPAQALAASARSSSRSPRTTSAPSPARSAAAASDRASATTRSPRPRGAARARGRSARCRR